jgi:hypothetical protein
MIAYIRVVDSIVYELVEKLIWQAGSRRLTARHTHNSYNIIAVRGQAYWEGSDLALKTFGYTTPMTHSSQSN